MRYKYITKIEIKFDKKKTFNRKSIKYLQNYIFQESVKLPAMCAAAQLPSHVTNFLLFAIIRYINVISSR